MDSKIVTGFDLSEKISALTRDKSAFVISDSNVAITYGSLFSDAAHYIIPAGEAARRWSITEKRRAPCWRQAATVPPP